MKQYGKLKRVVSNLTMSPNYFIDMMIDKGLLRFISKCLLKNDPQIFESSIWAISNMISEDNRYKYLLYNQGLYTKAINFFPNHSDNEKVRSVFSWFISNSFDEEHNFDEELVG